MSVNTQPRRGRRNTLEMTQLLTVRLFIDDCVVFCLWDICIAMMDCLAVFSNEVQGDKGVQASTALSATRPSGNQTALNSAVCWWGLYNAGEPEARLRVWVARCRPELSSFLNRKASRRDALMWGHWGVDRSQRGQSSAVGNDVQAQGLRGLWVLSQPCPPWHVLWIPVRWRR